MRRTISIGMTAIMLLLVLALPVAASDYTLGVFGNANEDETINMQDVTYTELIILEYRDKTELSDAKYDGKINMQDVTQIELVILGKEKEITILDGNCEVMTVEKPVERIIVEYLDNAELIRALGAKDRVVGVDFIIGKTEIQFPDLSKLPSLGAMGRPDYEAVLSLNPDLLLTFSGSTAEKKEKLPGIAVVFLGMYYPDLSNPDGSRFTDGVRKLGYILDARDEAEEYIDWRTGWIDDIKSKTEELTDSEKPRVFIWSKPPLPITKTYKTCSSVDTLTQMCSLAGGRSIAEDLPGFVQPVYQITVDPEWVIEQDPEYILVHTVRYTYGGGTMDTPSGYDVDDPAGVKELRDAIMDCPELANVAAVETGDVYILSGNFRNDATGGFMGATYMAKILHPGLFGDLDPEAIHQEYLTGYQGLDYDLNEHGVFLYPPIEIEGGIAGIPERYGE